MLFSQTRWECYNVTMIRRFFIHGLVIPDEVAALAEVDPRMARLLDHMSELPLIGHGLMEINLRHLMMEFQLVKGPRRHQWFEALQANGTQRDKLIRQVEATEWNDVKTLIEG